MSWRGEERDRVEDIFPPPPPVNVLQIHLKMGLATVMGIKR